MAAALRGEEEIDDVAMPDIGANALAIAFGNFKRAYVIIDRIGLSSCSIRSARNRLSSTTPIGAWAAPSRIAKPSS